jgi:hypothetical protein
MRKRDRCMLKALKDTYSQLSKEDRLFFFILILLALLLMTTRAHAVDIPGQDFSRELETLGSIAQTGDTIAFGWVRPFAAGVFLIIGCFGLVRSHFLLLVLGFGAAVIILLTPKIVKEISKKGGSSVLSSIEKVERGFVNA